MNYKCKCGSERFIRRWSGVNIHTPCTIDRESKTIEMDFSREEQSEDRRSRVEFFCAACGKTIKGGFSSELATGYQYE
jgi:predicted RNA-binding Zn-ribbon protein involved in translation (DUF1610 family)